MYAELITIGDEILIGQTIDTNSAWMAKELNAVGIGIAKIQSVQDTEEEILRALEQVHPEAKVVLITGGLGPTKDDVTKRVLTNHFGTILERNQEVLEKIEGYFESRGRQMLESNRRQADLPKDALILNNPLGTASGMWFERDATIYISMPGVPYEMKSIVSDEVIPKLKERFDLPALYHRTIMTEGIGESFLAEIIADWENSLEAEEIHLAYLPSPGIVKLRLSAEGNQVSELKTKIDRKFKELYTIIPQYIFGENDATIQEAIQKMMINKGLSLSTAESCTGGYLAHLITSVAGSSAYFKGSVVSYANEVKIQNLKVSSESIAQNGAVSQAVVEQMAMNVREELHTDFALATSGVAGPDGGSEDKPVGTVWIAIASNKGVYSKKFNFEKDRGRNIDRAAKAALSMLKRALNDQLEVRL